MQIHSKQFDPQICVTRIFWEKLSEFEAELDGRICIIQKWLRAQQFIEPDVSDDYVWRDIKVFCVRLDASIFSEYTDRKLEIKVRKSLSISTSGTVSREGDYIFITYNYGVIDEIDDV